MPPFKKMGRMAFLQTHRPWLVAAGVSVLVHLAMLGTLDSKSFSRGSGNRTVPMRASIRLLPTATIAHNTVQTPVPIEETPAAAKDHVKQPTIESATNASASPSSAPEEVAESGLGAYYFSSEELNAKPIFLRDAGAPSPTFVPDVMPLPVLVSVYINEQGRVDQVVLSDNFLSPIARQFIADSFNAMEFSPGMIGSLPVKSRLTTEVKLNPALPIN
jgi:hypothetical protein